MTEPNSPPRKQGYWNYRLMRLKGRIEMCEVYYSKKGALEGYCLADFWGNTPKELLADFCYMMAAFNKPVLRPKDFKSTKKGKKK